MKLEEALTAMRGGSKIRHSAMPDDEYYMACRVGVIGDDTPTDERPIGIGWMKNGIEHPDMRHRRLSFRESMDLIDKYPFLKEAIIFPTLNLLLIMSDEWEIVA